PRRPRLAFPLRAKLACPCAPGATPVAWSGCFTVAACTAGTASRAMIVNTKDFITAPLRFSDASFGGSYILVAIRRIGIAVRLHDDTRGSRSVRPSARAGRADLRGCRVGGPVATGRGAVRETASPWARHGPLSSGA